MSSGTTVEIVITMTRNPIPIQYQPLRGGNWRAGDRRSVTRKTK